MADSDKIETTRRLLNGDCLEYMKKLPDKSVDLFICDLPYGETNCKWDSKIDMVEFWKEFKRIRKSKRTACIHFCSTKFGYTLIKSWEKGYKMDMVWKKRNKTGGLQSRNRPMRNHEMVYFFYEQAPKYNRDKYHKRIVAEKKKEPVSVVEGKCYEYNGKKYVPDKNYTTGHKELNGSNFGTYGFEPPNPASVLEGDNKFTDEYFENNRKGGGTNNIGGIYSKENNKEYLKKNKGFEPPNPVSVVEEEDKPYGKACGGKGFGATKNNKDFKQSNYEPPNPASVVEEKDGKWIKEVGKNGHGWNKHKPEYGNGFEPPNPASVVEGDPRVNEKGKSAHGWDINHMDKPRVAHFDPKLPLSVVIPAEDEPVSMFESTKVFIGKRHHQTEKPQDILEFFLKYWTDEGDTVLDPTMGSGSTGVACETLNRNFIGYEMDPTIFKVAQKRMNQLTTP